jgi:hypothetical protein
MPAASGDFVEDRVAFADYTSRGARWAVLKGRHVIENFCDWLSTTSVSVAFQSANWFVPLIQTVHIISIAILLTSIYVISFRLIGLSRSSPSLANLITRSMPWIWAALGVLLLTGALLTITEPARELLNWAFRTKMVMVVILTALMWIIQARIRREPTYWTESSSRRHTARVLGVVALLVGAAIVTAGRWIAYV